MASIKFCKTTVPCNNIKLTDHSFCWLILQDLPTRPRKTYEGREGN